MCAVIALRFAVVARERLKSVDSYVQNLARRIHDLERARDKPKEPAPPVAEAPSEPATPPPPPARALPHAPRPARPAPEPARQSVPFEKEIPFPRARGTPPRRRPGAARTPSRGSARREPRPSLEERIGGRWFNWVGILAILFGVAYAMKYSFERGWVTHRMRFWSGLLFGVSLLAAGMFSERRRYAVLARGFWGGGIGVLFVVLFAGFKLLQVHGEPLLGRPLAFAGMALTVIAGVTIAIVYDTRTTAALSAIGGYLVPVLLRTGIPDQIFLFTYLLILTAGFLFLGYWKRWGFLRLLTFGVVVIYFAGWWLTEGIGAPWAMLLYPSVVFAFFAAEIVAWSAWRRVADAGLSYVVLGLAATLHTLSGLSVLHDHFIAFRGAFLLATAAYLLLGARTIARRHPEDMPLALCYGYGAAALFLLAPVFEDAVHGYWHGCIWALQGAALFAASEVWGARGHVRIVGYAAFALAALRLLGYDTPEKLAQVHPYLPFWNARGLAFAIVTASFVFGCYRSWRRERAARVHETEHLLTTGLWIVTLSLPAVFLTLELTQGLDTYLAPRFGGATRAYENQASHWMTLLWAAYATLVATATGAPRRARPRERRPRLRRRWSS